MSYEYTKKAKDVKDSVVDKIKSNRFINGMNDRWNPVYWKKQVMFTENMTDKQKNDVVFNRLKFLFLIIFIILIIVFYIFYNQEKLKDKKRTGNLISTSVTTVNNEFTYDFENDCCSKTLTETSETPKYKVGDSVYRDCADKIKECTETTDKKNKKTKECKNICKGGNRNIKSMKGLKNQVKVTINVGGNDFINILDISSLKYDYTIKDEDIKLEIEYDPTDPKNFELKSDNATTKQNTYLILLCISIFFLISIIIGLDNSNYILGEILFYLNKFVKLFNFY